MKPVATRYATNRNPWTNMSTIKRVNPDDLKIDDAPYTGRIVVGSKYADLFAKLKVGQCIKCPVGKSATISNSLQKYARLHHPKAMVRHMSDYGDGAGRVWLLAKEKQK